MSGRSVTPERIAQALALKGELPLRKAAEQLHMSRDTVLRIWSSAYQASQPPAPAEPVYRQTAVYRCPGCGGLVATRPCVKCRLAGER